MLTKRQKLFAAGLGSAFLHAVVLLAAGIVMSRHPAEKTVAPPEPIRLQIVKADVPEEPASTPTPTPEPSMLDNAHMKEAERPVNDPKFQGAKDTVAASNGPATGDKPLPSQEGRQAPTYAFDPAPPVAPAPATSAPPADAAPPATAPPPPAPVRPAARPPANHMAPTRVNNELALLDVQPTPPPEEVNPYDPSFRSTAPPPPVPVRKPAATPAYRPMAAQTFSRGNITARGVSSVDAVATPFGRYKKALCDSIQTVWTQELQTRGDIASLGSVVCHFAVDRSGHVHAPRVLSNSSNEGLAAITLDAVSRAPIPPIPPEVVESMNGAMLELDVTFECL